MTPQLFRHRLALAGVLAAALALPGCISLFGKTDPAQLYSFTGAEDEAAAAVPAGAPAIQLGQVSFNRAAASDRILTTSGRQAAYIAASRWVSPAEVQFMQGLKRAFAEQGGVRLVDRQELVASTLTLTVDVPVFETRYLAGDEAAPTVVVETRGRLLRFPERAIIGEDTFRAEVRASDNRVTAIAEAYAQAVDQVQGRMAAWAAGAAR
ncbi:ABC-type transport auxiliary lipoprotein family protein [Brevundimonas sp. 2R-24]|uniref:ABC-type transport auxiliary lipoprotein family protein n=1 Tax=Peiella sedimenti TaxID=3061083 RepID=A0ABT8SNE9_9CAUL|nr:ABC-type transport auxiliary lipoprotein family protein [Caulobacteraceae bacterium XZ-24]